MAGCQGLPSLSSPDLGVTTVAFLSELANCPLLLITEAWQANLHFKRLGRPSSPPPQLLSLQLCSRQTLHLLPVAASMDEKTGHTTSLGEKQFHDGSPVPEGTAEERASIAAGQNTLHRELRGRHMQMIAMYDELQACARIHTN